MKILYINHYAGSLTHGMEYRPYYLAREWVRSGHQVMIVASSYTHLRRTNLEIADGTNYLRQMIDGIIYLWCKTPPYKNNGLKRLINIFTFLKRLRALKSSLVSEFKPDLVIASSTYPFDAKPAWKIAQAAHARFIFEVHDLWPLTLIEVSGMSRWHPLILWMHRAENFAYRNADKVVSLLPKAIDHMCAHGMTRDKFVYIPNGVASSDWISNRDKLDYQLQNLFSQLKLVEQRLIIGYAGGMGEANALDFLLDAFAQLKHLPLALVMVGSGAKREHLEQRVKDEQLDNVYILGQIGKSQIPEFLASCDGLYLGWNKLPIYRFGICPNKLFDYMLSGKPIVHSVSAGNDLVEQANCGISIAAEDVEAIASAFLHMLSLKAENLQTMGRNGYNFVLSNHEYRILATRFLDRVL